MYSLHKPLFSKLIRYISLASWKSQEIIVQRNGHNFSIVPLKVRIARGIVTASTQKHSVTIFSTCTNCFHLFILARLYGTRPLYECMYNKDGMSIDTIQHKQWYMYIILSIPIFHTQTNIVTYSVS